MTWKNDDHDTRILTRRDLDGVHNRLARIESAITKALQAILPDCTETNDVRDAIDMLKGP